jgi:hypothetical protein
MNTASPGILIVLFVIGASGAAAQQPPVHPAQPAHQPPAPAAAYRREVSATLARQARITEDSAREIAMRRVPGGVVQALELEREGGRLIYSFDLKLAGHPGIEEVHVDALNGSVLAVEHETPHADSAGRRPAAPARSAPAPRRP